jgi:Glycosyl hydrolases family 16
VKHESAGNFEWGADGLGLVLAKRGDSPTIDTDFYILFGSVEAKIKAAQGVGMISSLVTLSDTRDEWDWVRSNVSLLGVTILTMFPGIHWS